MWGQDRGHALSGKEGTIGTVAPLCPKRLVCLRHVKGPDKRVQPIHHSLCMQIVGMSKNNVSPFLVMLSAPPLLLGLLANRLGVCQLLLGLAARVQCHALLYSATAPRPLFIALLASPAIDPVPPKDHRPALKPSLGRERGPLSKPKPRALAAPRLPLPVPLGLMYA